MAWEGDVVGGERDSPERGFVGFGPPQNTVMSKATGIPRDNWIVVILEGALPDRQSYS